MSEETTYIHKFILWPSLVLPFAIALSSLSRLLPNPWSWLLASVGWLAVIACFALIWIGYRETKQYDARARQGGCLECGYDLRATPDRCPKCGTPVERPKL